MEPYDFDSKFPNLVKPLIEEELLIEKIEEYLLTEKGEEHLKNFINSFNNYDIRRSDTLLLAMARDK